MCEVVDQVWESKHKARKEYKCSLCYRPINKGDTYVKYKHVTNGDWGVNRYHELCERVYQDALPQCFEGLPFDEFHEVFLRDEIANYCSSYDEFVRKSSEALKITKEQLIKINNDFIDHEYFNE